MGGPLQKEQIIEFTTANLETAIDFANLARLAAESCEESEAQYYAALACDAYEQVLDSLETEPLTKEDWESIRPLMQQFEVLTRMHHENGT